MVYNAKELTKKEHLQARQRRRWRRDALSWNKHKIVRRARGWIEKRRRFEALKNGDFLRKNKGTFFEWSEMACGYWKNANVLEIMQLRIFQRQRDQENSWFLIRIANFISEQSEDVEISVYCCRIPSYYDCSTSVAPAHSLKLQLRRIRNNRNFKKCAFSHQAGRCFVYQPVTPLLYDVF